MILRFIEELFSYDPHSPLIFNSGTFLFMFIFFITIYAFLHKNKLGVTIYVILFGCLFYYKSSGWYLLILIITTFTDFGFAYLISRLNNTALRRTVLIVAITGSLGLLSYFKYTNFFLGNFYSIMGRNFQPLDIFLPIGVSFYTFQSMSYMLDVYWKKIKPCTNIINYAFFITFFPQLVAGPIVKANWFLPQIEKPITFNKERIYSGFWMIMIGLFKKAIIADYISQYNDLVFSNPTGYSGFENLMAVYGYTLQIYCDFSGYSDMAIGIARIMGFDLGVNFNFPYKSKNITDFWRRWHMSLSTWLRDYLYISLGGNRKGKIRTYINLFITMFLGGLWHGATWKFVFWGGWHGIGLAIHKATKPLLDKIPNKVPTNAISWFITFHFVVFLWIFFRANNLEHEVYKHVQTTNENTTLKSTIDFSNGKNTLKIDVFQNDSLIQKVSQPLEITKNNLVIRNKTEDGNQVVIVNQVEDAFHVAWSMITKIGTDMDLAYLSPFFKVRYIWVILMIIGFTMHATPTKWNDKIMSGYIKSPYLLKIFIFIILVQMVIQFKSANVQPFIYFQF
jgi:alginate O-acetyltransferase complex protein AlgI